YAAREAPLPLQPRGRAHRVGLALDLLPLFVQVVDLVLAALLGKVFGHGADDPPARVFGDELGDHVAKLGALIAVLDLAGDTDLRGERHVDQEPAGERHLRGDARSLGTDRFFDDLDELGLTLLQLVGDVRQAAARPAPSPSPSATTPCPAVGATVPVVVLVVRIARLVFVLRFYQVGGMEEGALFGADVDEGRLYPRQDRVHGAEVDVTHRAAGVGTIHQELNKAVVLQDGHAGLPRAPAD